MMTTPNKIPDIKERLEDYGSINNYALSQISLLREQCEILKPLVVILTMAYNHEKYIKDTLDGFVMQKTNFPFIAIVHDDASIDNTTDIIKKYAANYPNIIYPIFEYENQYSKPNAGVTRIMRYAAKVTGAKYIALCEGDDYWIDEFKLQKQVDYLESHPEYTMACGKVKRFDQKKHNFIDQWGNNVESFEDLLMNNCISTPTVLMRKKYYDLYIHEINPSQYNWRLGDYPMWLFMAGMGKINFDPQPTTVYRILPNSASHFSDYLKILEFSLSTNNIQKFFCDYFNVKPSLRHIIYIRRIIDELKKSVLMNDKQSTRENQKILMREIMSQYTPYKLKLKMLLLIASPSFVTNLLKIRALKRSNH